MNHDHALENFSVEDGLFPVPEDIRSQVDELREKLRPVASERGVFGFLDEEPCFVSGMERLNLVLSSILDEFAAVNDFDLDGAVASRGFLIRHALEGELRYLENLILWTKLTWKHDPTVLAEFVSEAGDDETQRAIEIVQAKQAERAALRARMAEATEDARELKSQ